MKNNIRKLLICGAFASAIGVVSLMGDVEDMNELENIEIDLEMKEIIKQTKGNQFLIWNHNVYLKDIGTIDIMANNNMVLKSNTTDNTQDDELLNVYMYSDGWTSTAVNIRKEPNTSSEILTVYEFNTCVSYAKYNEEWSIIKYGNEYAYIYSKYISDEESKYQTVKITNSSNMKTWMPYMAITAKSSPQYKLQQMAYTGEYGIRMYNGRYCVAVGTGVTSNVGTYIDLVLANGTVIPCIVGDIKANAHTDSMHLVTRRSNCCSEFIIDKKSLHSMAKRMGDISYTCNEWNSKVVEIRIYDIDAI